MDREPIRLDQDQHEEGSDQKQMGRAPINPRLRDEEVIDHKRQHRFRQQRNADEDKDERRLGENSDHDRAAGADAAVSAARIETSERNHE